MERMCFITFPPSDPLLKPRLRLTQGPSSIIFVKKMVQRCGVWQIKRMSSQDQDQVSMKSNMFGFRGYSQMKFYKTHKTAKNRLVWFGLVRAFISC